MDLDFVNDNKNFSRVKLSQSNGLLQPVAKYETRDGLFNRTGSDNCLRYHSFNTELVHFPALFQSVQTFTFLLSFLSILKVFAGIIYLARDAASVIAILFVSATFVLFHELSENCTSFSINSITIRAAPL